METLPVEIKLKICFETGLAGYSNLLDLRLINSDFRRLCDDESMLRRLFELNYPSTSRPSYLTWRQAHLNKWMIHRELIAFANGFIAKYHLIEGRYCRSDPMIQDISDAITTFLDQNPDTTVIDGDTELQSEDFRTLNHKVFIIATGVRPRFIDPARFEDRDLDAECDLIKFLNGILRRRHPKPQTPQPDNPTT